MDFDEQLVLSRALRDSHSVLRMKQWVASWIRDCNARLVSFGECLVALAVSRGLLRCSMRAVLACSSLEGLENLMAVIEHSNEASVGFACRLFHHGLSKPPPSRILEIIREGASIEQELVRGVSFVQIFSDRFCG